MTLHTTPSAPSEHQAAARVNGAAAVFLDATGPSADIPTFITSTNARELFGLRPGESVADAIRRSEAARG